MSRKKNFQSADTCRLEMTPPVLTLNNISYLHFALLTCVYDFNKTVWVFSVFQIHDASEKTFDLCYFRSTLDHFRNTVYPKILNDRLISINSSDETFQRAQCIFCCRQRLSYRKSCLPFSFFLPVIAIVQINRP